MSQVKLVKECIDKNIISVDCAPWITERFIASSMCHECVIEDYSKLKEKTYYSMTQENELIERTIKLYKTKKLHFFQFHCELNNEAIQKMSGPHLVNKMEFYIMYDHGEDVCPADLVETNYGFSIEVPNEVISDPRNTYLKQNDKLVIQLRYRHYFYTRGPICRSGFRTKEDEKRLSEDLLYLYESGMFTDLEIIDEDGQKHPVHKSICRSRSKAINNIDDDNVVAVTVGGKSHHVDIAVKYMYGGILPQLSVDDLLKVTAVAEELDIERLRLSLQLSLLEILNRSNAVKIRNETKKFLNMCQIAAHAEELLPEVSRKKKGHR